MGLLNQVLESFRILSATDLGRRRAAKSSSGSYLLQSDLCNIFPQEMLDIFREVHDLARQLEVIAHMIKTPEQLDDLEYRCVSVQYYLLSFDYNTLQSMEAPAAIDAIMHKLRLSTSLIFFGNSL
jgi:hypothetical protein